MYIYIYTMFVFTAARRWPPVLLLLLRGLVLGAEQLCIYIYIYIYVCVSTSLSLSLSLFISIYVYIYIT